MIFQLITLILIFSESLAMTIIRTPGCYQVHGTIQDFTKGILSLETDRNSRSQETIKIKLSASQARLLKSKTSIDLKVIATRKGPARNLIFEGDGSQIHVSKNSNQATWIWIGPAKGGKCKF